MTRAAARAAARAGTAAAVVEDGGASGAMEEEDARPVVRVVRPGDGADGTKAGDGGVILLLGAIKSAIVCEREAWRGETGCR